MNETPVDMYWIAPLIQWVLFLLVALVGFRTTTAGRAAFWLIVVFVAANVVNFAEESGPRWEEVTRHSDTPEQVIQGIRGLQGEATGRITSLRRIRFRALEKAEENGKIGDEMHNAYSKEWLRTWQEATNALSTVQLEASASDRPAP